MTVENNKSSLLNIVGVLFLIIITATSLFFIQRNLTVLKKSKDREDTFVYVPSGRLLKIASLGLEQMLSDLYWLKAVQHIGDRGREKRGFKYLYPLINLVTDLDPNFEYAYEMGGVVLSIYAGRIDESNKILKKGVDHGAKTWEIPFYLGFNHFYYLKDYETAAHYISIAAKTPGRPAYVPKLAARLYAEAGNPDTAIDFLKSVYETTDDERVKKEIEEKIRLAGMERDIQFLEKAYGIFEKRFGRPPQRLDEMVKGGIINMAPDEPFGGYYYIDPETGEIKTSSGKERFKTYKTGRLD